jgi:glycosyltransferase involved in cell wall biosynthesis
MPSFRKKFLHLSPVAGCGGCEVNCLRIIEGLGNCDHRVLVFDEMGPMSAQWEAAGAKVDHLGNWQKGMRKFRLALAAWAESQTPPDGVFVWSTSRLPAVIEVLARWRMPWCVYLGNPVQKRMVPTARRWAWERFCPTPRNLSLVACSNHVAATHRQASYFRRFSTTVIYNAVDPDFDRPRGYRALPVGSRPRVGMVARLDSIKDHATALRALSAVAAVRSDFSLEFAGDGILRGFLEREAERLGLKDRVRFLGFKPVGPLLAEWDIYLHATTAAEGMGTAVAEAMMAGLPCLVSDLAVMREVCGDDGAAYASAGDPAAFGQSLLQLIDDRVRRESLGSVARRRARRLFSLPQIAAAYLRVVSTNRRKQSVGEPS